MYSSSSEGKNKYCDICGRLIKDEPIIPMGEKELCEECWLQYDENDMEDDNGLDREIIYIIEHKEEYTKEKLMEVLLYLRQNGHEEAIGLEKYINDYNNRMAESDGIVYSGEKAYKKSRGNIWIGYFKILAYISWLLSIVAGLILGSNLGNINGSGIGGIVGGILGGIVGFIIGFIAIAFCMLFVTMAENISTIADRTTEIMIKLEGK